MCSGSRNNRVAGINPNVMEHPAAALELYPNMANGVPNTRRCGHDNEESLNTLAVLNQYRKKGVSVLNPSAVANTKRNASDVSSIRCINSRIWFNTPSARSKAIHTSVTILEKAS